MNATQHTRLPQALNSLDLDSIDIVGKYAPGNEWMWISHTGNAVVGYTDLGGHDSVLSAVPYASGVIATLRRRTLTLNPYAYVDTVFLDTVLQAASPHRRFANTVLPEFKDRPLHLTLSPGAVNMHPLYRRFAVQKLCGGFYRVANRQSISGSVALNNTACWKFQAGVSGSALLHQDVVPGFGLVYQVYERYPGTWPGTGTFELYYFKFGPCTVGSKMPVLPLGGRDLGTGTGIGLFPNPADQSVTVRVPGTGHFSVRFVDITGRLHPVISAQANEPISITHLPKGFYFVYVFTEQGHSVLKLQVVH